jgi:hypothetical protein
MLLEVKLFFDSKIKLQKIVSAIKTTENVKYGGGWGGGDQKRAKKCHVLF